MILTVRVKPNAKMTKFVRVVDEKTIEVALHARAAEGKANEELISFLAEYYRVAKSSINIKRGQRGRVKHIEIL